MQKTIFSILWNKFLTTLEQSSWYDISLTCTKLLTWSFISIFLINIPESMEKLAIALKWYDFAILKILAVFIFVFYSKSIFSIWKKVYSLILESIPELPKTPVHWPQYFWIPIIELVDYIFTSTSYSRSDFCEHFGVSRKVFDDLANWFDKIEVFTRWANNSRVLSSSYSRGDISSILTRASEVWEIRPLIRKTDKWYSHTPSMWDIISRSPTGFTTYRISWN